MEYVKEVLLSPFDEKLLETAIWVIALLVYPNKGGSKNKAPCGALYQQLGDDGILIYRNIFSGNNHDTVESFFSSQVI